MLDPSLQASHRNKNLFSNEANLPRITDKNIANISTKHCKQHPAKQNQILKTNKKAPTQPENLKHQQNRKTNPETTQPTHSLTGSVPTVSIPTQLKRLKKIKQKKQNSVIQHLF
jgi:hypothetical protein